MKPINLRSLVNANESLPADVFSSFLRNYGIEFKVGEIDDLINLHVNIAQESGRADILNDFYVGFKINQISKEFDLLRFGDDFVLNIELKRTSTEEKVKKQLTQNRYYLSFLRRPIINVTFISSENRLLKLEKDGSLCEIDFSWLCDLLSAQMVEDVDDIHEMFDPTHYLVSPFNSTDLFLRNEYFLTDHQEEIKKKIILNSARPRIESITGSAGTGKTLLTYDIAHTYIKNSYNVLVIHCGILNNGHRKMQDSGWSIIAIKHLPHRDISTYDLVIIDEAQRISTSQLSKIIEQIKASGGLAIFSFDPQQYLHRSEGISEAPQKILEQSYEEHKLTDKIRTNKELAAFIRNLFNLSHRSPFQKYSNVNIGYFDNNEDARDFIVSKTKSGWKAINLTPSRFNSEPFDNYIIIDEDSAHEVIGQEFDYVIAIIDRNFGYDASGQLTYRRRTYYHATKMLFQVVTRTRKKLYLVIVNNETMLKKCLAIINPIT